MSHLKFNHKISFFKSQNIQPSLRISFGFECEKFPILFFQPIHFFEFWNLKSILSLNSIFSWILPPTSSPLPEWAFALGTNQIYLLSQQ